MTIRRRSVALLFLVLTLLVAVACTSSEAPVAADPDDSGLEQTALTSVDEGTDEASGGVAADDEARAVEEDGAVEEERAVAEVGTEVRTEVTGAPVAPPTVGTVQAEASETPGGGRFPPLNDPRVVLPEAASWLDEDALVLGAVQNGDPRAYPVFMMTFHHVVNDVLGGEPYLVTF